MEMTFNHRKLGTSITLDVPDYESAVPATREYIWAYGMRQALADSYASAQTPDEFDAKLRQRHDAIMKGTMGLRSVAQPKNPVETEMKRLATLRVKAAATAKGWKLTKEKLAAYVESLLERDAEELRTKAEANLAEVAEAAQGDDLDDLFGEAEA